MGRLFDDESRHLDRFGSVLVLSILAVTVNMLIDLDDPTASTATEIGWIFVTVVSGVTLITAAAASGVAIRWRRLILLAVLLVIGGAAVSSFLVASGESSVATGRPTGLWVIVSAATPWFVLRRIFKHDRVTGQTLAGAVSVYLLLALAFAYGLSALDQYSSQPIFGTEEGSTSFMYFSMVTITTLGYGDLSPVTTFARYLATTEALLGQIFLVTVVARLVSLFGTGHYLRPAASAESTVGDEDSGNGDPDT
jgi:voltage-gated potassium channel Kch